MLETLATARPSALVLASSPLTRDKRIKSSPSPRHGPSATLPLRVSRFAWMWAQLILVDPLIPASPSWLCKLHRHCSA